MKFVKGDNIKCINSHGMTGITVGTIYICIHYSRCADVVLILNDNNIKENYSSLRFVKV